MKRAIFLGTFNPPHKGHCDVLQSVIEALPELEKIYVIPCWQNPNKDKSTPYDDRYEMCKRQFNGLSNKITIDSIEKWLKPTYTYQLIDYIREVTDDFWWIVTEETIEELIDKKWKKSEQLLKENNFIVLYPEERHYVSFKVNDYFEDIDKWPGDYQYIPLISSTGIHSTQIREMIKEGNDVSEYINEQTEDYINKNKIFK